MAFVVENLRKPLVLGGPRAPRSGSGQPRASKLVLVHTNGVSNLRKHGLETLISLVQVAYYNLQTLLLIVLNLQPRNLPCYLIYRFYLATNLEIWRPTNLQPETLKSGDLQTYKLGKSILHSLVAHKGPADIMSYSVVFNEMGDPKMVISQTPGRFPN